ncbi:MAG: hypothetical protein WAV16_00540 [Candidatus Moraniibacteriota bacterium]
MEKIKIKWLGLILVILFSVAGNLAVYAEDDEREDEDEEHQEEREDDEDDDDSSSKNSTKVVQTSSTSKSVETIILKDSDGDGILDKDDAHPQVAEIYIVKDDNRNGIVDSFEK